MIKMFHLDFNLKLLTLPGARVLISHSCYNRKHFRKTVVEKLGIYSYPRRIYKGVHEKVGQYHLNIVKYALFGTFMMFMMALSRTHTLIPGFNHRSRAYKTVDNMDSKSNK